MAVAMARRAAAGMAATAPPAAVGTEEEGMAAEAVRARRRHGRRLGGDKI